jgi:hypothetical protein
MSPRTARKFWVATFAGLGVFDLWLAKNATDGDSLSECCRAALRTDTQVGRAVFVGAWAALSSWLIPHICRAIDPHN